MNKFEKKYLKLMKRMVRMQDESLDVSCTISAVQQQNLNLLRERHGNLVELEQHHLGRVNADQKLRQDNLDKFFSTLEGIMDPSLFKGTLDAMKSHKLLHEDLHKKAIDQYNKNQMCDAAQSIREESSGYEPDAFTGDSATKIPWAGGKCPVDETYLVVVEFRNGKLEVGEAGSYYWERNGSDDHIDIVNYWILDAHHAC